MSTITITVRRSDKWVAAARLDRAANVPQDIDVGVPLNLLSVDARKILLEVGGGQYPTKLSLLHYRADFTLSSSWASYGSESFRVDSDSPTADQIDDAILNAYAAVRAKASAAEWASMPIEWRASAKGVCYCRPLGLDAGYRGPLATTGSNAYDCDDLKKYAPEAWAAACAKRDELAQAAKATKAIADRAILADFIACVPADALRGALKAYAKGDLAAARKEIEDASPVVIFEDDEDEDEDCEG